MNLIEAHGWYDPPKGFRSRFTPRHLSRPEARELNLRFVSDAYAGRVDPDVRAWIEALYDGEIAYLDQWFGQLLALLDERGLADDTVVILTSDHGEGFGEHAVAGFPLIDHQLSLHRELLEVPLIVRLPDDRRPQRVARAVSSVDVAPTILALAGVAPAEPLDGRSLFADPPEQERILVSQYFRPLLHAGVLADHLNDPGRVARLVDRRLVALQDDAHKLIQPSNEAGALYALPADRAETRPMPPDSEAGRALELRARASLVEMSETEKAALGEIDAESQQMLRKLGYLE